MTKTRIGIIGVGNFGLFFLEQSRLLGDAEVTYLADLNQQRTAMLAQQFGIPHYTADWHELVNSPEVDIVYIATPPSFHGKQATAALNAGKHVFCEKPIAISLKDADDIFAAAKASDVRVGIDFIMRYSELYEKTHAVISSGLLGVPKRFLFENNATDLPASHWFWDLKLSGGIPIEHGVHFFDIFEHLFGAGRLNWAKRTLRPTGEEDEWLAVFQYGQRMFGSFYHGFYKPRIIEQNWASIELSRGRIRLEGWIPERMLLEGLAKADEMERLAEIFPDLQAEELHGGDLRVLADGREIDVTHRVKVYLNAGEKNIIYGNAVRAAVNDFIAWTKNPRHRPCVTGEDARRALEVAIEVIDMGRRGK